MNHAETLLKELKQSYGNDAAFREGQLEAIQAVLENKRLLVVQKTGWGKSLVYFLATKMIRKKSSKFSLIISPLLVLMDNQIDSASRLGLYVKTINSSNKEEWNSTLSEVKSGSVDALIISPERLANEDFKNILRKELGNKIGMFVVDEAHCISDWGHDFRPDYRRIVDLIRLLPPNIPVLATTATANDRVVNDIKSQLGDDLQISRGSLLRESIIIQTIALDSREERLIWLKNNVDLLPGTGIVYCLTVSDCRLVDRWLQENGISSRAYYADMPLEEKQNTVRFFMENKIKVLSATVAFGMGFDKPDIGFVVHFQRPGNLVAYYQQIGRAGRQIPKAYAIMLYGNQDDEINEYFIGSAFPSEEEMTEIVRVLQEHPGLKRRAIEKYTDLKSSHIEKILKFLDVDGDVYAENSCYYKTPKPWKPDMEKCRRVTEIRKMELQKITQFCATNECYMKFIAKELDDKNACSCGKCSNCTGVSFFCNEISKSALLKAQNFIRNDFNIIEPRKQWPDAEISPTGKHSIDPDFQMKQGRVLSNYGDAGWGRVVSDNKYHTGRFSDELVEASADLLRFFIRQNSIRSLTFIPSRRRPELVKDFAKRLAQALDLDFFTGLEKSEDAVCQKALNNSFSQYKNANDSFIVTCVRPTATLLVDDMVDSRWTFTCCSYKLLSAGHGPVYPYALANSAGKGY